MIDNDLNNKSILIKLKCLEFEVPVVVAVDVDKEIKHFCPIRDATGGEILGLDFGILLGILNISSVKQISTKQSRNVFRA